MADAVADAIAKGDGEALAAALARKKKPESVKPIAAKVDIRRWDEKAGRALLGAAEWICKQAAPIVRDFLPCLAIATIRALHGTPAERERARAVLSLLRPCVVRDAWVADLVARSGCHYLRAHELPEHAKAMRELVREHPGIEGNPFFAELARL